MRLGLDSALKIETAPAMMPSPQFARRNNITLFQSAWRGRSRIFALFRVDGVDDGLVLLLDDAAADLHGRRELAAVDAEIHRQEFEALDLFVVGEGFVEHRHVLGDLLLRGA